MQPDPKRTERARSLRNNPTVAETTLWRELRNRRFARHKFRRQQPIGPFFVDFFCSTCTLAIELDGDSHLGREAYDADRQAWLEARGIRVIRITNVDIADNFEGVMHVIDRECSARSLQPPVPADAGRALDTND